MSLKKELQKEFKSYATKKNAKTRLEKLKMFPFLELVKAYNADAAAGTIEAAAFSEIEYAPAKNGKEVTAEKIAEVFRNHVLFYASSHGGLAFLYIYVAKQGLFRMVNQNEFPTLLRGMMAKVTALSVLNKSIFDMIFYALVHTPDQQIDPNLFDHQERYIAVKNGVVDLKTGKLEEHSPKYGFTRALAFDYDEKYAKSGCSPEMFADMLKTSFPDKADRNRFVDSLSFAISNNFTEKKAFVWIGKTDTGKSTYIRLLTQIVGRKNVRAFKLHKFSDEFTVAHLADAALNICAETTPHVIKDIDSFKLILGNDTVEGSVKHKESRKFDPRCKCLFATNYDLRFDERVYDGSVLRRLEFIKFFEKIKNKKQKANIEQYVLKKEGTQIVSFLIGNLRNLYERNFIFTRSKNSDKVRAKFERINDKVNQVKKFIKHCLAFDPNGQISYKELDALAKRYFEANGFPSMTPRALHSAILLEANVKRRRQHPHKGVQFYVIQGLRIKKTVKK